MTTRDRIVAEGMRLFAERGYAATSVAEIEKAAGLSPGSGGLYKHFRTKEAVLEAGVRERIAAADDLAPLLEGLGPDPELRPALAEIARVAFRRLDGEHDLNRLLVRDLSAFPQLLAVFRDDELRRLHTLLTEALRRLEPRHPDPEALAAIAISAVSHHWTLADVYGGTHPLGVDRDRFAEALADLIAAGVPLADIHSEGDRS
jgi:AcrR family transcriptional regulator